MSQYTTTNDLILDVLWRSYESTSGSSQYADAALRYLNRAYRSFWTGGGEFMPTQPVDWWWMRHESTLTFNPYYSTGTIQLTQGSTIGVLSTPPAIALQDYWLLVDGSQAVYRISSHVAADIGIILDSVFVDTSVTAATFKAIPIDYSLPGDCIKIIDPLITHRENGTRIFMVDMSEMWKKYPLIQITMGTPRLFAPVSETSIRLSHYLDNYTRADFFYLAQPADLTTDPSSAPEIPVNYRHVLADMACFFLMTDKEDSRAPGIGAQAKAGIAGMMAENRKRWDDAGAGSFGQILPRPLTRKTWRRTTNGLRLWWGP